MSSKAGWDEPPPPAAIPILSLRTEALIRRASHLTAHEIARLDVADRSGATNRTIAWDLLRNSLDGDPELRRRRLAARELAWRQVNAAAVAAGLQPVVDDVYWLVAPQATAGAARLAGFVACVFLAPELLDPDVALTLTEPWRSIIGSL